MWGEHQQVWGVEIDHDLSGVGEGGEHCAQQERAVLHGARGNERVRSGAGSQTGGAPGIADLHPQLGYRTEMRG